MWYGERKQVTDLVVLRFIPAPGHPSKRSKFHAIVFADLRPDGTAFLFAAKTHPPLRRRDWRELIRFVKREYGATRVEADRKGSDFELDTESV